MARRFLTDINLNGNQLIKASFEKLSTAQEPTEDLFEGRVYYNTTDDILKVYDGTQWIAVGAITAINGTTNEVEVSITDGVATIGLPNTIYADVVGDLTGNADTATYAVTAGTANAVASNSVALATDTTGDYVAGLLAGTGISLTLESTEGTPGEGETLTVANADKGSDQNIFKTVTDGTNNIVASSNNDTVTIEGTSNEVTVDASGGTVVIGLPDDVTIGNDLIVSGDLTVSGTTTTVNTETINLADNIITLNSNFASDPPTENAGIEVERGTVEPNVVFRWNETAGVWEATTDGTNYYTVLLSGQTNSSDIADFDEAAQDAVGVMVADTDTVDITYTDGTPELKADVKLATTSYLTTTGGLALDYSTVVTQLVTDTFTRKVSGNVGNGVNTSFAITHNLGTRDVVVNIYDNTTFDTVEADVIRTDANNVTVSFAVAPSASAYRVVVVG